MVLLDLPECIASYDVLSENTSDLTIKVSISVPDESIFEVFRIKINFAAIIPQVLELDFIIPWDIDRHVSPTNGFFCVAPHLKITSFLDRNSSNRDLYIKHFVIPFLKNQIYFSRNGEWINGEYSHYDKGIIEFYSENVRQSNLQKLIDILEKLLANRYKYERNYFCFCGSGLKYKKCHYGKILTPNEKYAIQSDIDNLKKL